MPPPLTCPVSVVVVLGIALNGSATTKYEYSKAKLEFLASAPDTFKPGLVYTAFVSV